MSDIDWSHVEDLAEAAYRADSSVISGFDFGCGFRAGYLAALIEEAVKLYGPGEDHCGLCAGPFSDPTPPREDD